MTLVGKSILLKLKADHQDASPSVDSLIADLESKKWDNPHELKQYYPKASLMGQGRVVFNICGNKYRVLALFEYKNQIVKIIEADIHKKYDHW